MMRSRSRRVCGLDRAGSGGRGARDARGSAVQEPGCARVCAGGARACGCGCLGSRLRGGGSSGCSASRSRSSPWPAARSRSSRRDAVDELVAFAVALVAFGSSEPVGASATRARLRGRRRRSGRPLKSSRPKRAVLLINPKSGGGKAERFDLRGEARQRGVEPVLLEPGDDLVELAERAVGDGADVIERNGRRRARSQALVATIAMQHDLPHVYPRGHAQPLRARPRPDRDDVVGALDAFTDGVERRIDLARVNERVFVNNASLGVYAQVCSVGRLSRRQARDLGADAARAARPRRACRSILSSTGPMQAEYADAPLWCWSRTIPTSSPALAGAGSRPRLDTRPARHRRGPHPERKRRRRAGHARDDRPGGTLPRPAGMVAARGSRFARAHRLRVGLDGEALTLEPPCASSRCLSALRVRLPRHAAGVFARGGRGRAYSRRSQRPSSDCGRQT